MRLPSLLSRVPHTQEEMIQTKQLVSFRIGEEEFGVDILMVQEIIRLPTITPIPNAPESILGMINLRGKIIPIIDLRQRLRIRGNMPTANDRRTRILIVEMAGHVTGFIVDSVSEVMKVEVSQIEPTPHLVVSSIDAVYIQGVIKLPNRLIILLDFRQILKPQEERELALLDKKVIAGDLPAPAQESDSV
ncbi:CheW protein [Syntrophobacter fumaroxidans MPOB]|uniref:CheW protein n=2 Tax=Syntrophobacter TaxID=29526 RepID=A0LIT2_SYNFM|nr:CheW protein [Syntrophobacter fumaroxidans MPOB]